VWTTYSITSPGAGEDFRWQRQTKTLGGLHVDHRFKFVRPLIEKICGPRGAGSANGSSMAARAAMFIETTCPS
jgi:hypothetical protein